MHNNINLLENKSQQASILHLCEQKTGGFAAFYVSYEYGFCNKTKL